MEYAFLLSLIMSRNYSSPYHVVIACREEAKAQDLRDEIEDILDEPDREEMMEQLAKIFTDNKASYIGNNLSVYNFFNNSSRHISDSKRMISDMDIEHLRISIGKIRLV